MFSNLYMYVIVNDFLIKIEIVITKFILLNLKEKNNNRIKLVKMELYILFALTGPYACLCIIYIHRYNTVSLIKTILIFVSFAAFISQSTHLVKFCKRNAADYNI